MGEVSSVSSRKLQNSVLILGNIGNLCVKFPIYRSSHPRCSVRKGVLRTFAKFTGKHLCKSLFFNKVASLRPARLHRSFVSFAKFLRTPFLQNTSYLQVTLQKNRFINSLLQHLKKSGTYYIHRYSVS